MVLVSTAGLILWKSQSLFTQAWSCIDTCKNYSHVLYIRICGPVYQRLPTEISGPAWCKSSREGKLVWAGRWSLFRPPLLLLQLAPPPSLQCLPGYSVTPCIVLCAEPSTTRAPLASEEHCSASRGSLGEQTSSQVLQLFGPKALSKEQFLHIFYSLDRIYTHFCGWFRVWQQVVLIGLD